MHKNRKREVCLAKQEEAVADQQQFIANENAKLVELEVAVPYTNDEINGIKSIVHVLSGRINELFARSNPQGIRGHLAAPSGLYRRTRGRW